MKLGSTNLFLNYYGVPSNYVLTFSNKSEIMDLLVYPLNNACYENAV